MKKASVERLKREYERVKAAHSKLCEKLNTVLSTDLRM
jgi:archaellum component FlaC